MKKLIITGLAVFSMVLGHSQDVTVLDEVKLGFTNLDTKVVENGNKFTFNLKGTKSTDLINRPIKFLNDHFDIENFIAYVENSKYDGYQVIVNSSKGTLSADYDRKGNLLKTSQNFTDVMLPRHIMKDVYANYKGWEITKNRYLATTKGEILDKQLYKMRLKKGNKRQTIKMNGRNIGESVASNSSIN